MSRSSESVVVSTGLETVSRKELDPFKIQICDVHLPGNTKDLCGGKRTVACSSYNLLHKRADFGTFTGRINSDAWRSETVPDHCACND